ncbi:hypothetical protein [Botrimarina sp.]|uniref:hypothetical protein n=1 Tax=Botrimarina sp. TaxID=2795802 RepID=UPI0032EF6F11
MDFRRPKNDRRRSRRPGPPPGGPSLRLAALLAGLLLVLGAMAELRQPDTQRAIARAIAVPPTDAAPGARLVAGDELDAVTDNAPFRADEQAAWFATLRAVRDAATPSGPAVGYTQLNTQPDAYRGRAVAVAGEVLRVEEVEPAQNDDGFDTLWRTTLAPAGGDVWPITVYTIEPPPPAEPPYKAEATGLFFKKLSYRWAEGVGSTPVIVARRLATNPAPAAAPDGGPAAVEPAAEVEFDPPQQGSLGRALLAELGVPVDRFDTLAAKRPLLAAEAELFYSILGAVGATPAAQLARLANAGLGDYADRHASVRPDELQAAQVARAIRSAEEDGRYSVVPLFLGSDAQRGELVSVDALVRRVVRVDASASAAAAAAGVSHYYELEAFTDDSQNLPLVFCFRELPPGMPLGERVEQPARLAGFFFKRWAYAVRKPGDGGGADARQFAPLLIGRAPILLEPPRAAGRPGWGVGLAAAAVLLAVVFWLWRQSRSDRRYQASTLDRFRDSRSVDPARLAELARGAPPNDAP